MQIRKMQESDIDDIVRLENMYFSVPWHRQDFEMILADKRSDCYVVYGERVAAYCTTLSVLDECEITNIAVDEAFRRQGIARRLLEYVISQKKSSGAEIFMLEVRAGNAAALALYRGIGFEAVGERAHYYTKPDENAILMTYSISH